MTPETVDGEYAKLEQQANQVTSALTELANKLQAAAGSGDQNAREWLLDLKSLAIQIQGEQLQMHSLMQAMHDLTVSQMNAANTGQYQQQPAYAPQPRYAYQQGGGGGMLGRFLGGGFGRAIVTGAGFGIGDDIINSIF